MIGDVSQMTKARHYADDDFVPSGIAAEIAHASASLMKKLRRAGEGPAYFKIGRSVRYRVGDVRTWLESKRVTTRADYHRKGAAA
jgi:predicted DNA-binding transcriptional regulator AlpA